MNREFLSLVLIALLNFSCSSNVSYDAELEPSKSLIIAPIDSAKNITVISSMEEFYLFLAEKVNLDSLDGNYLSEYPAPNASITTITKMGYTDKFMIFEDCENLEIYFSDFQTADKLGLIAHKTYFVTIGQVGYSLQLQDNQYPSTAESLECGLLLNDPRTDDFVHAPRGYRGVYKPQTKKFVMATELVYFLDYTDDPKIWYPCSPENLKWNVNILEL